MQNIKNLGTAIGTILVLLGLPVVIYLAILIAPAHAQIDGVVISSTTLIGEESTKYTAGPVIGFNCQTNIDDYDYKMGRSITLNIPKDDGDDLQIEYTLSSEGASVLCGRFANGDYWVAPMFGKDSVTVDSVTVTGNGFDGVFFDENPTVSSQGLLPPRNDSGGTERDYDNYVAEETLTLPFTSSEDTSFVVGVRQDINDECGTTFVSGNCVEAYSFITILDEVPPTYGKRLLRPPIDEATKYLFNVDTDMRFEEWPSLSNMTGTDTAGLAAIQNRWNHCTEILSMGGPEGEGYSEGGRAFRCNDLIDDYSANRAQIMYNDLMTLFSDDNTWQEKDEAVYAMINNFMDVFFSVYDCDTGTCNTINTWKSGAGQWLGRGPNAVIWASFMKDLRYANILSRIPEDYAGLDNGAYQEVEQLNIGHQGQIIWGDGADELLPDSRGPLIQYISDYSGSPCRQNDYADCPESKTDIPGQRTSRDPFNRIDGPPEFPSAIYSSVISGPLRGFAVVLEILPRAKRVVNYDNNIASYVTRVHYEGALSLPDDCAPEDTREPEECAIYKIISTGHNCEYFSLESTTGIATYGPIPTDLTYKSCITNGTTWTRDENDVWTMRLAVEGEANYGQVGRFAWANGTPINLNNISPQVETNFEFYFPDPNAE